MISATTTNAASRTRVDHLEEARWICRRVPTLRFEAHPKFNPKTRSTVTVYRIYRRGMGQVASRSSPAALLAYLRKQVPA